MHELLGIKYKVLGTHGLSFKSSLYQKTITPKLVVGSQRNPLLWVNYDENIFYWIGSELSFIKQCKAVSFLLPKVTKPNPFLDNRHENRLNELYGNCNTLPGIANTLRTSRFLLGTLQGNNSQFIAGSLVRIQDTILVLKSLFVCLNSIYSISFLICSEANRTTISFSFSRYLLFYQSCLCGLSVALDHSASAPIVHKQFLML